MYIRKEIAKTKDDLIFQIKCAIGDRKFHKGKVWIDLLVEKPNNKGDAINVLDTICDCIKIAIGIDDRYFSIRRLDWDIIKTDPKIFIGIGQEITEENFACTYCGLLKSIKQISSNRRTCLDCRHPNRNKDEL